jgi:hypothetical protein
MSGWHTIIAVNPEMPTKSPSSGSVKCLFFLFLFFFFYDTVAQADCAPVHCSVVTNCYGAYITALVAARLLSQRRKQCFQQLTVSLPHPVYTSTNREIWAGKAQTEGIPARVPVC